MAFKLLYAHNKDNTLLPEPPASLLQSITDSARVVSGRYIAIMVAAALVYREVAGTTHMCCGIYSPDHWNKIRLFSNSTLVAVISFLACIPDGWLVYPVITKLNQAEPGNA